MKVSLDQLTDQLTDQLIQSNHVPYCSKFAKLFRQKQKTKC